LKDVSDICKASLRAKDLGEEAWKITDVNIFWDFYVVTSLQVEVSRQEISSDVTGSLCRHWWLFLLPHARPILIPALALG
jgi:hypothetical protein